MQGFLGLEQNRESSSPGDRCRRRGQKPQSIVRSVSIWREQYCSSLASYRNGSWF